MNRDASFHSPDLESRSLHAALDGCPIGAAVVAQGRLSFANALFVECTRLAPGVEGLRIVLDDAPFGANHATPGGNRAALFWNAPDGSERRMTLVAHTAPYGGEEAFFLWIPVLADNALKQDSQHVPASGRPAEQVAPTAARARVLLAEDNEINQEIAAALLENAGVEVHVASNGKEAVELFLMKNFDLILMDIQMPLMDGMDAARTIRASGKAGADTVPILAMTAHETDGDRENSLNAGMNAHLTKPIEPKLLYEALDVWLSRSMRPDAAPDATPEDFLAGLQGFDARAGLSNVAGNLELYQRLLDRFADNYRNSGEELRDALKRARHDPSAFEEAVRLAHTAKGVAANLGAHALAAVAGELESALKKNTAQEDMFTRYDQLLKEALDSIAALPKPDEAQIGQRTIPAADKERIAALLQILPPLMETDWHGAQQKLLALAPVVEDTAVYAHYREVVMALDDFDLEGMKDKGKSLLRQMGVLEQGEAG